MPSHVTSAEETSGSIPKAPAAPRRSRWRRAVILFTSAALIGALVLQINRAYNRAAATRVIEAAGGTVYKRWRMEPLVARLPWLFTRLPVPLADSVCRPFKVESDAPGAFSDRDLQSVIRRLSELPDVEILNLRSVPITDAGLKGIASLRLTGGLGIFNCPITDGGLAHLHGLTDATQIWLVGTDVTASGCRSLQRALPNCKIFFDPDGNASAEEQRQFYAGHSLGF